MRFLRYLFILSLFTGISPVFSQRVYSPSDFLAFETGSRFSYLQEVQMYCDYLTTSFPDKFKKVPYGTSPEGRPLFVMIRTSPQNLKNLEEIQKAHWRGDSSQVLIQWFSFNIHGDEAAGTETALQLLYSLAISDAFTEQVIIIDPCLNPDGRERFVTRINPLLNSFRLFDPQDLKYNQPWPQGRYNHYLADLNRDWCWGVQPETRQRLKLFHDWAPHIHADFHEMEPERSYFFPPSAEPIHPVIPESTLSGIQLLGKDLKKLFHENKWEYFSEKEFDLLYPGYGDTYSTFNGSLGLTLEQGGSAEAATFYVKNNGDTLTLRGRIEKHLQVALSLLETSQTNRKEILANHRLAAKSGKENLYYFIRGKSTAYRNELLDYLDRNQIEYQFLDQEIHVTAREITSGSLNDVESFEKGDILISLNQRKSLWIQSMFESMPAFPGLKTYDISVWQIPLLFHARVYKTDKLPEFKVSLNDPAKFKPLSNLPTSGTVSFAYNSLAASRLVSRALKMGLQLFTEKNSPERIYIRLNEDIHLLSEWFNELNVQAVQVSRADWNTLTTKKEIKELKLPKIAVVYDERCEETSLGDQLYFLENTLELPFSLIPLSTFSKGLLDSYNTLLINDGFYRELNLNEDAIKRWIANGGRLILSDGAMEIAQQLRTDELPRKNLDEIYYSRYKNEPFNLIQGCIFEVMMNNSGFLKAGIRENIYLLFHEIPRFEPRVMSTDFPAITGSNQLISGYAGQNALPYMDNSFVLGTYHFGDGAVIQSAVNLLFRNIQMDGQMVMSNAILMPLR